jgi:D-arabinose 1-dehydrogenase-like Zn-dependent alcohol dehydrogenase
VDLGPRTGTFADHVSAPATPVARIPDGVEPHAAAVIGLAGIAAHDAIGAPAPPARRDPAHLRSHRRGRLHRPPGDLSAALNAITTDGVDKGLHLAGDPATIAAPVRSGGAMASTLGATPDSVGRDDITLVGIMAAASADKLAHLLDLVATGKVRVNIEATVPLERAQDALGRFADGTLGRVLVTR